MFRRRKSEISPTKSRPAAGPDWWQSASNGDLSAIKALHAKDHTIINRKSPEDMRTAAMLAARRGHLPVVRFLIENRADVNLQDKFGVTALSLACFWNRRPVVHALLDARADPNVEEVAPGLSPGKTALMAALEKDHADIVSDLLHHDRSLCRHVRPVEEEDDPRRTPLDYAGPLSTLRLLPYGFHATLLQGVRRSLYAARELSAMSKNARFGVDDVHLYQNASIRAQVLATGLLALRPGGWESLREAEGLEVMQTAVNNECKLFVGHQQVQNCMLRMWHGEYIDFLLWYNHNGRATELKTRTVTNRVVLLLIAIPLNLLLLPIAAAIPPLDAHLSALGSQPLQRAFEVREELILADLYLLKVPMFKFWLTTVMDVLFAALLTFGLRFDSYLHMEVALFIWACMRLSRNLTSIMRTGSSYFADPLHYIEIAAAALTVAACSTVFVPWLAPYIGPVDASSRTTGVEHIRSSLLGIALPLTFTHAGLAPLTLLQDTGPLVLILQKMGADVWRWLCVLMPLMTGFSAGLLALYAGDESIECNNYLFDSNTKAMGVLDNVYGMGINMLTILDTTLGTSVFNMDECLFASSQQIAGTAIWDVYRLTITVLMINTLIAMMAKTFDHVHETLTLSTQFLFAQRVLAITNQANSPPPFSLLSLPYQLIDVLKHGSGSTEAPMIAALLRLLVALFDSCRGEDPAASATGGRRRSGARRMSLFYFTRLDESGVDQAPPFFDLCESPHDDFPEELAKHVQLAEHTAPDEDVRFKTLTKERLGRIEELLLKVHHEMLELKAKKPTFARAESMADYGLSSI